MENTPDTNTSRSRQERRTGFLEKLLEIEALDTRTALGRAALLIAEALNVDKADIFLYDESTKILTSLGISDTPMGRLQSALSLHKLPIEDGGSVAIAYQTGESSMNNHVDQDPNELEGVKNDLGVRSAIITALVIGDQRRGVIQAVSAHNDFFTETDLHFLEGIAHWVGIITHRVELVTQRERAAATEGHRLAAEELMTILAHDLHNYLTPLKARVDLLMWHVQREKRQRDIQEVSKIQQLLQRFAGLITDLMDTSRLSRDLFTLSLQLVDLSPLLEEIAGTFQTPEVPIKVQIDKHISLWADPERLRQALENLVANSVKYAPKGTDVKLTAEVLADRTAIQISVADQGPGIPAEVLPYIFEPFRASAHSTGLGLGLYLARQIAYAHKGTLIVDPAVEQGTRFVLTLPLLRSSDEE